MKRKIITIDAEKCNGCGLCIPNCPEGAIQIIDRKARLISDLFCDGLGACIGHCPEGAISIEERDAQPYDERQTMENIVKGGENVIAAHLRHLKDHGETELLAQAQDVLREKNIPVPADSASPLPSAGGCPGMRVMDFRQGAPVTASAEEAAPSRRSQLRQWPVQLKLVPAFAPYLNDSELVVAADCAPFAYGDFHRDFLKGKTLVIMCPKLDHAYEEYVEKLTQIFTNNHIRSVSMVHMEVPCCFGLVSTVQEAVQRSGKAIPMKDITVSVQGQLLES